MKKPSFFLPLAIMLLAAGCNQTTPAAPKNSQPATQDNTASPAKGTLKTYKSDVYGFELQYPADWKSYQAVTDQPAGPFIISAESQMQVALNNYEYVKKTPPIHWLDTIAIANRPSYSRYIGSKYLDYEVTNSTVQGKTVVTALTVFREEPPNYKSIITDPRDNESPWLTGRIFRYAAFQCQERLLCVIEERFPDEEKYRNTMDQILSTLTFGK